jgi:Fe-S oxidoreductase
MDQKEFSKFVLHLLADYRVYSPQEENNQIIIAKLVDSEKVALDKRLPFYPWKNFFVPDCETLFEYQGIMLEKPPAVSNPQNERRKKFLPPLAKGQTRKKIALLGINILDLRAILLYDLVFALDPYYQARQQNALVIGHGFEAELPDGSIRKFSQDDLEHLRFDIFLAEQPKERKQLLVFAGSEKGRRVLDEFGYRGYQNIEFAGHKYSKEWEEKMNLWRDKLKNHHNQKIWDELGKICLECGKCTIACPTCFCFRIDDTPSLDLRSREIDGKRQRCWDSCYYQEFSEVAGGPARHASQGDAGGHKFLNTTASKIHFWYFHKFGRIPDEYNMMGCVGCHRCHTVCPVDINIQKVMEEIENSQ